MCDVYIVFMKNCEEYFAENYFNRRRVTGKFLVRSSAAFTARNFIASTHFTKSRNLTLAALKSNLINFNWKQWERSQFKTKPEATIRIMSVTSLSFTLSWLFFGKDSRPSHICAENSKRKTAVGRGKSVREHCSKLIQSFIYDVFKVVKCFMIR